MCKINQKTQGLYVYLGEAPQRPAATAKSYSKAVVGRVEAELLNAVLARGQLGHDDAKDGEHRCAAVVELTGAHLHGLTHRLPQSKLQRVAVVADGRHCVLVVLPQHDLQQARDHKECDEAIGARRAQHGPEAAGHVFETREVHHRLDDGANCRHHGHPAVLHLCDAQLAEALLIPDLGEVQRIEETQGHRSAELLRGVKGLRLLHLRLRSASNTGGARSA
mmetsp:Transcript_98997/g.265882  ORF Transcript_98997/g.265882 Transcript_98997/m.265882 type:complete len:221 (-) Transcript_98997:310-972(-)